MKKLIFTLALTLLMSLNVLPATASLASEPLAITQDTSISPMSEETVWYNRIYNGMLQRRLWSVTYGKWLTEWEDVAPVE